MIFWLILAGVCVASAALIVAAFLLRRRPRKLDADKFQNKWRDMQKLLVDKQQWPQAIVDADNMLADALKRRRFVGKTVGERLTKAQHDLTDNEGAWLGHKLRNKLDSDPSTKLKEKDVKAALVGIRQALKDLGAFRDGK